MSRTRRLTLSAMLVALGGLMIAVGRYVEIFDLALVIAASFLVAFARLELGGAFPYLVYGATALLAFLLAGISLAVLAYLCFGGIYPILKYPAERYLPRAVAYAVKLIFALISASALTALSYFVLGLGLRFGIPHYIALAVLSVLVFLLYDYTLTRMTERYFISIRPRFSRFLK